MNKQIALISEHASPLSLLGGVDCGGQNLYVGQVAKLLAGMGYHCGRWVERVLEHPCVQGSVRREASGRGESCVHVANV